MRRVAELLSLRRSSSNHEPKYAVTSNGRVAPNFLNPPPPHMYQHPQQQPQAVSTVSRGFIKDCLSPNEAGGSSREESPVLGHKTIANCAIHGTLSRPPQPLPPMTSKVSTACQTVHPPPPGNYYNTQTAFCPWGVKMVPIHTLCTTYHTYHYITPSFLGHLVFCINRYLLLCLHLKGNYH